MLTISACGSKPPTMMQKTLIPLGLEVAGELLVLVLQVVAEPVGDEEDHLVALLAPLQLLLAPPQRLGDRGAAERVAERSPAA